MRAGWHSACLLDGPPAAGVTASQTCSVCVRALMPDTLGLVECPRGWGGPGDPLEVARGFSRGVTRLDRRLAPARRELTARARG